MAAGLRGAHDGLGAVYPVNDRFVSYWDPVAREAIGSDFVAEENRKRRRERYRYDFGAGEAIATRQFAGKPPVERRYGLEAGTVNLASAAFRLRNTALAVGQVHQLPIFTGDKRTSMRPPSSAPSASPRRWASSRCSA